MSIITTKKIETLNSMAPFSGSLDANILLRLILNDVPAHTKAAANLVQNSVKPFAVADTAIVEIVFVLERHYRFARAQIAEVIEGLASLREISCNRRLFAEALPLFLNHPALSFEDCCLASYATLNQAEPLWTFDKKLANQVISAALLRTDSL